MKRLLTVNLILLLTLIFTACSCVGKPIPSSDDHTDAFVDAQSMTNNKPNTDKETSIDSPANDNTQTNTNKEETSQKPPAAGNDDKKNPPVEDEEKPCSHDYGAWEITTPASCTAAGKQARKCKLCNNLETEEIAITEHSWKNATCTTPKTCKNCSAVEGSPTDHVWVNATCTENKHCKDCGFIMSGTQLSHTGGTATCTSQARCTRCYNYYGEKADHDYVDATCTKAKHCSNCNATVGSALPHNYVNGACTMCSKADPSLPTFEILSVPMSKGGCKITSATTSVSGNTLYLTVSGVRESGSSKVRLTVQVFTYGYTANTASTSVYLENISAGDSFSKTIVLSGAILSEYNRYVIWLS